VLAVASSLLFSMPTMANQSSFNPTEIQVEGYITPSNKEVENKEWEEVFVKISRSTKKQVSGIATLPNLGSFESGKYIGLLLLLLWVLLMYNLVCHYFKAFKS